MKAFRLMRPSAQPSPKAGSVLLSSALLQPSAASDKNEGGNLERQSQVQGYQRQQHLSRGKKVTRVIAIAAGITAAAMSTRKAETFSIHQGSASKILHFGGNKLPCPGLYCKYEYCEGWELESAGGVAPKGLKFFKTHAETADGKGGGNNHASPLDKGLALQGGKQGEMKKGAWKVEVQEPMSELPLKVNCLWWSQLMPCKGNSVHATLNRPSSLR